LGFGFRYRRSHKYSIPDCQDVDVGFLKCFFPTLPVDLSKIATSSVDLSDIQMTLSVDLSNIPTSSINPSQTASSPVDLSKTTQNPPLRLRGGGRIIEPIKQPTFSRPVPRGASRGSPSSEPHPWSCVVLPVVQWRVKEQEVQYLVC